MRLTLVISSLGAGGAERVLTTLACAWAARGHEVTLITQAAAGGHFYPLAEGVAHHALGLSADSTSLAQAVRSNCRRVRALRRAVCATAPDVVISFVDRTNILTLLATRGLGVPVVVSERTHPCAAPLAPPWRLLRGLLYPWAASVVVQTDATRRVLPRRWPCHVIPNPVVAPPPRPPRPSEARLSVVAMGRLDRNKGFASLVDAFARVAPECAEWDLVIWGEGTERVRLERMRDERGLRDRIDLPGRTRDSYAELQRGDLFVLSSLHEGFPNVLCEAMACGLPVLAADCLTGPREIVRDGIDGRLYPAGDTTALASSMRTLMRAPGERERLAARAPEVVGRFSLERILCLWDEVLP